MPKTPAKRKADAVTFEDDEDGNDGSSFDSENDDEANGNNEQSDDEDAMDEDDTATDNAKTPSASTPKKQKTPGSSPGMTMRSGKKKKRSKPSNAAAQDGASTAKSSAAKPTPRKRAKKNTDDDGKKSAASAKKQGKSNGKANDTPRTKLANDWQGMKKRADGLVALDEDKPTEGEKDDTDEEDEEMVDESKASEGEMETEGEEKISEEGPEAEATVRKVPPETTREAVAAAQVTETIEEQREEESEAPAAAAASAAPTQTNGTTAGGILRLVSQKLRLPSQHTPKPPSTIPEAASTVPPPAGGRRLIFETTAKKKDGVSTTTQGGTSRGGGRNKLLMQTRAQQSQLAATQEYGQEAQSTQKQHFQTTAAGSGVDTSAESTPESATAEGAETPSLFSQLKEDWEENGEQYKKDAVLYTKGWFVLLLACFILGNVGTAFLSDGTVDSSSGVLGKWNVQLQSANWGSLYGIDRNAASSDAIAPEEEEEEEEEVPPDEPETITQTKPDPKLLKNAKATMRAHRMNLHYLEKLEVNMKEMQTALGILDTTLDTWSGKYDDVDFGDGKMSKEGEERSSEKSSFKKIDEMKSTIAGKQNTLLEWEWALVGVEEALDLLEEGTIGPSEVNEAMSALAKVSMMPSSGGVLDSTKIILPGEGCEGKDYVPMKIDGTESVEVQAEDVETVEVVGAIDVEALDVASDAPVRLEDAQTAYQSLLKFAQSTSEAVVGPAGPTSTVKRWVKQVIQEQLHEKGVDDKPPPIAKLDDSIIRKTGASESTSTGAYTAKDAVRDIDRLLEMEDADRTGKFDYASVVNGARVLRRGPYATSYSLYESLPLLNRVLAQTSLRFYGHPPEVALQPTFPMHARGQCWSFSNEFTSARSRRQTLGATDDLIGEYATLTVSLSSAIAVSEVNIEHLPPSISRDPTSAIREFRVLGFEDGGAFGEPWELGTYSFQIGPSLQSFSIPTVLDGQNVPKLKAISIAVDSNHGAKNYSCLYRVRVHGA